MDHGIFFCLFCFLKGANHGLLCFFFSYHIFTDKNLRLHQESNSYHRSRRQMSLTTIPRSIHSITIGSKNVPNSLEDGWDLNRWSQFVQTLAQTIVGWMFQGLLQHDSPSFWPSCDASSHECIIRWKCSWLTLGRLDFVPSALNQFGNRERAIADCLFLKNGPTTATFLVYFWSFQQTSWQFKQ